MGLEMKQQKSDQLTQVVIQVLMEEMEERESNLLMQVEI